MGPEVYYQGKLPVDDLQTVLRYHPSPMSPSPHSHGQANSGSSTVRRMAGPAVLILLVVVALAMVPGPAIAQMAVDTDGSTTIDPPAAAADVSAPSVGADDVQAVGTMGAATTSDPGDGVADPWTLVAGTAGDAPSPISTSDRSADAAPIGGYESPAWGAERPAGGIAAPGAMHVQPIDQTRADATMLAVRDNPSGPSPHLVSDRGSDLRVVGDVPASADSHTQPAGSNAAIQGEHIKRPWGLNPSAPVSPATLGGTAIGFLLGAGAFAVARPGGFRAEWFSPSSTADRDDDPALLDPDGDDDLVPDEAIVEGMLLRRDGRMKQSAIVDMTDWSKAKVSRLLSTMADEGRVVKVSIGRENLICLDGWEPDAVRVPTRPDAPL